MAVSTGDGVAPRTAYGVRAESPAGVRGGDHTTFRAAVFLAVVIPALAVAMIAGITIGSTHVDWRVAVAVLGVKVFPFWFQADAVSRADEYIIWLLRVPRVILAAGVGSGLAVAGALMQGLFRNPLAEPNIVGVGSGAVLGAVAAMASGFAAQSALALPLAAFCGALLALGIVYVMATHGGTTPVSTLLLSGIAVGALFGAMSSLLISFSVINFQVAQEILFWMLGGLDNRTWTHVWISMPFTVFAMLLSLYFARDLDLLLQGEESATSLGVEVERTKRAVIVIAALMTGVCVAVAGSIGFVGLIVPHVVRLLIGPAHRRLLPFSALAGAAFLVLCDLLARTINAPMEIRLGVVTAGFGAPFFLFLLIRKSREVTRL